MWRCVLQATLLCVASHAILVRLLDDFSMTVVPKEFQEAEGYNESETSFTPKRLTRWFVVAFFHSLLRYQWHIWLERALPTRPRGNLEAAQKANVTVELDEDKEEEVVKRWIAQGRVRRASVSWCNIILKWILLMLLGNFTACVLDSFVESAFDLRSITGAISKFQDVCASSISFTQSDHTQLTNDCRILSSITSPASFRCIRSSHLQR